MSEFAISATASLQERRSRTLKYGDMFAVFDQNGDLALGGGGVEGLYASDTRHLSQLDLRLSGARPILLSSTTRDDNATLTCDLTNPDLYDADGTVLDHDLIHIRRTKFLFTAVCHERLAIRNFSGARQRRRLEIRFDADFADLFEVRGQRRSRRGRIQRPAIGPDCVTLAYTGLDDRRRTTRLRFDPAPDLVEPGRAVFDLDLPPGGRAVLYVEIRADADPPPVPAGYAFFHDIRLARRELRHSASRAASVATSNQIFNEAVRRSVSDLSMLLTETPQGPYPYAGIPWYSTAFGRDAIITALQMLWMDPAIARGVLSYLAANQATARDPAADAEPGKILHEVRRGEMAELGEVPFRRYYGSVDSTPLFVMLAGAYLKRTGDLATLARLWPHIEAAIGWMQEYGDRDGDGFIEYYRMTENGLANQGWKDSHDSIFHADGAGAEGPIALCEVQGYAYAALLAASRIAKALERPGRAQTLAHSAKQLRHRIDEVFWCEDIGTYALALDGAKRPCRVRSSNAGHLLMAGVPSPKRAAAVTAQMMGSASFSGWGIRTIASGEARYNPMSYHNGSVWPHDNAMVALGFSRYGLRREAARILEGLFQACIYIELRRLPELVCGFPRRRGQGPTSYPVACAPQAWSAAAQLSLLQSCLGIGFDLEARTVIFDRPVMPSSLDEITLRNLAIGDARIDVRLACVNDSVAMCVLSRSGEISATLRS
ncbi:MAG: amylo-alpha-1,6-glucosidase [Acetobacteraceae bacterium]|nr:amylo-alpha-1,6-glucosidase [Acetobacteraceae bacterium]